MALLWQRPKKAILLLGAAQPAALDEVRQTGRHALLHLPSAISHQPSTICHICHMPYATVDDDGGSTPSVWGSRKAGAGERGLHYLDRGFTRVDSVIAPPLYKSRVATQSGGEPRASR
ncbi:hypothetical protein F4825DRAFT_403054 [Nemania diffusa]|nr:hypothetical protein F4825DRAFT_403054 [Nemania diffusa]